MFQEFTTTLNSVPDARLCLLSGADRCRVKDPRLHRLVVGRREYEIASHYEPEQEIQIIEFKDFITTVVIGALAAICSLLYPGSVPLVNE